MPSHGRKQCREHPSVSHAFLVLQTAGPGGERGFTGAGFNQGPLVRCEKIRTVMLRIPGIEEKLSGTSRFPASSQTADWCTEDNN